MKHERKVSYTDGKVAIRSDDFTHDAVLYLTGDFATHEVAINYASKLAARLNANNLPTPTKSVVPEGMVMVSAIEACKEMSSRVGASITGRFWIEMCIKAISSLTEQELADGWRRFVDAATKLHESARPDDGPDQDAIIPARVFREFVDAHADMLRLTQAAPDTDVSVSGGLIDKAEG